MRSHRVDTQRLRMHLVESGPEDGEPVVLLHGNLSTGRFFEHLFDDAPARFRLLAPDMRGFGDTERLPLDATRGLRDWADDTAALLAALGIERPPHLAGWSTGGAAIAAFALDRPVASLTFIDPVGPYGYGATRADGTPHFPDFAGSGGGTGNPAFTARLAAGDRSADGDTAPRNVMNSSYWRIGHREPPEREDMLLDEILKSVTGDDGYPGDSTLSEHWPGVAPGTRGILNALSPKYTRWADIVELDPKPPVLWTHGTDDIVVADGSPWEMGTLGRLGAVPGWPGEDAFAPQPMVAQIRAVLERYAAAGGRVESERFEGSGHFPPIDAREAWSPRFFGFLESVGSSYTLAGLELTEHELSVPLDHAEPDGERITLFAREVAESEGRDKPFLLYLQGGPGFESPRPTGIPRDPGWMNRALKDFRVLLLDQRGTGRSTPVDASASAEYLRHFRADAIVRDAECLRKSLGAERWSVLGQSFGGLCVFTYLSLAPEGLREAFVTGGVPGLGTPIDDVYRATYERVLERNRRYYARFPEDRARVRALAAHLEAEDVRLPTGDRLSARRLRTLGVALGMSDGPETLHHILELPPSSPAFLHDAQDLLGVARNPIYAVLHEACWADGGATRWSAERMRPEAFDEQPELFTAEHIFPWLFEEYGALAPLRDAAHSLAERDWPRLYDPAVLADNEVPVAAAIYTDDLYVERAFSEETLAATPNLHGWITSEYDHNGLRVDGERILGRLIDLVRGRA